MTTPPKDEFHTQTLEQQLAHRIQAMVSARTPTQRRQATSAFARMLGGLIREYAQLCPLQRYCLMGCEATALQNTEVRLQEKLLERYAPDLAAERKREK